MSAAKRKGSFKKWLRSSHRKFTSNATTIRNGTSVSLKSENNNAVTSTLNGTSKYLNLTTSSDLENLKTKVSFQITVNKFKRDLKLNVASFFFCQKLLSNSEDLEIKKWMIEESNVEEQEEKKNKVNFSMLDKYMSRYI